MWQAGGTAECQWVARRGWGQGSCLPRRGLCLAPWLLLTCLTVGTTQCSQCLTSLVHRVFGNICDILGCVLRWTESEEAIQLHFIAPPHS